MSAVPLPGVPRVEFPASRSHALDRFAIVLIAASTGFLLWAVPAPFFVWTVLGSGLLLLRSRLSGRPELVPIAIIMPLFVLLRAPIGYWLAGFAPHTVDGALLRLDFGYGVRFYDWVQLHPFCREVLRVAYYDALPFWLAVVMAWSPVPREVMQRMILATLVAIPVCGFLFPAVGPVWVHTPNAPRNCLPSMHFTWALMAWWYSGPRLRWPSALLVALTALATIGLGEHYIVDLVAAIPFAFLFVSLRSSR